MRNPITIEDHESARYITAPLRLLDYCLINDGAVCLILTSKERARDFAKPPVLISGFGAQETFSPSSIANFDMDFWYPAISAAGRQAYDDGGGNAQGCRRADVLRQFLADRAVQSGRARLLPTRRVRRVRRRTARSAWEVGCR